MRCWWVVGFAWACGGGRDEERFLVDGVDTLCAEASACAGSYDAEVCVDALRAGLDGCTFDEAQAADCEDALADGLECEVIEPFTVSAVVVPDACAAAFDCGKNGDWTAPLREGLPTVPAED